MMVNVVDRTNHLKQKTTKDKSGPQLTYLFPTSLGASPNGSRLRELLLLNELMSSM